jgi:hypothetical protein
VERPCRATTIIEAGGSDKLVLEDLIFDGQLSGRIESCLRTSEKAATLSLRNPVSPCAAERRTPPVRWLGYREKVNLKNVVAYKNGFVELSYSAATV